MPAKGDRVRDTNGKFSTKRKLQWKENLKNACKRRKIQNEDSKESIVDGRRVVEIKMLAEEMWCPACNAPLSFRYVENENVIGLASIFRVRCHTCLLLHEVRSNATKSVRTAIALNTTWMLKVLSVRNLKILCAHCYLLSKLCFSYDWCRHWLYTHEHDFVDT